jgi:hypothetical protein
MISSHPLFDSIDALTRAAVRPMPSAPSFLGLLRACARRLRPRPPLPPLSAHLCRDIGIEPPPRLQDEVWHLYGRM